MTSASLKWIKPQLTRLVDEAPAGDGWLHEIKYHGYRMHAQKAGRRSCWPEPASTGRAYTGAPSRRYAGWTRTGRSCCLT